MGKNIWDKEREALFREFTQDFMDDGYTKREARKREARKLAKHEVEEIMSEKMDFIEDMVEQTYDD